MILNDILEKAIGIICDDEIKINTPSPKLDKLIRCTNMIYQELTEEYAQLKDEQEIEFVDFKANFSAFPQLVKDIISIYKDGVKQDFTVYPNYVCCSLKNGKAMVRYCYHPKDLGQQDQVILPPKFTANVLAIGASSEYFYRSGLIDEAAFYKNRYDTSIINLTRHQKSLDLKVRRFL